LRYRGGLVPLSPLSHRVVCSAAMNRLALALRLRLDGIGSWGNHRMRILGIVALCVTLTGCAASRQEVVARLGDEFVGQNVDALVVKFGPPTSTFKMNSGQSSYVWQLTAVTDMAGDRGYAQAQTRYCKISVIASPAGIVTQLETEDPNAGTGAVRRGYRDVRQYLCSAARNEASDIAEMPAMPVHEPPVERRPCGGRRSRLSLFSARPSAELHRYRRRPYRPWEGEHACNCGGAGAPCQRCNPSVDDTPPRPPKGFRTEFDKKGWRH
jgi:hypothetical protein